MNPIPKSTTVLTDAVGTQIRLPFRRAFAIAVGGIRIRLGRCVATVLGVMLGIAFLMNNLTTPILRKAVASERDVRRESDMMLAVVRSELGEIKGQSIAVAVFGNSNAGERRLVGQLAAQAPGRLSVYGLPAGPGLTLCGLDELADGSALLLVLGDAAQAPVPRAALARNMTAKVLLDARADRVYPETPGGDAVRHEPIFGEALEQQRARMDADAVRETARTRWIVIVSLIVTVIVVANALLMSVTERFREIGTMKCLGALSSFIRQMFLIESAIVGLVGASLGVLVGALLPVLSCGATYGFGTVLRSTPPGALLAVGALSLAAGVGLSIAAAIYPAAFAARMLPANALRSNV
ncbi:MAG: ABC transporter permease [bacterium]